MSNKYNKEIKENVLNWSRLFFGSDFVDANIDEINSIIDNQLDEYDKEYEQDKCSNDECDKKEIVDTAVNTMKCEQEKVDEDDAEEDKEVIDNFSTKVTAKESLQIHKIVSEYIDSVIKPRVKKLGYNNDDMIDSVYEALYEFACWMLLK